MLYGNTDPTRKEEQIIKLVSQGLKNKDIGVLMGTTENMIKNYLRVIYDKLGLWNRVELAMWYVKNREHERKKE